MADKTGERRALAPQVEFEYVRCPVCDHDESSIRYSFADAHGAYGLVRCNACGHEFLNSRPTRGSIGIYYSAEAYQPFLSSSHRKSMADRVYAIVRKFSVRWKRRQIERQQKRGSVLDLGCGTGEFLAEMQRSGWKATGLEPSLEAVKHGREVLGLDIIHAHVDESPLLDQQFDVITMWHALEHVHRLHPALRWIYDTLKPDGRVYVAVPNMSGFDGRFYGKHWVALDPPRHLHHFSYHSMARLIEQHGFKIHSTRQIPLDTLFNVGMSEATLMKSRSFLYWPWVLIRAGLVTLVSLVQGTRPGRSSTVLYEIRKGR